MTIHFPKEVQGCYSGDPARGIWLVLAIVFVLILALLVLPLRQAIEQAKKRIWWPRSHR